MIPGNLGIIFTGDTQYPLSESGVFSAHAVKMVSSDVRITGAVARQTGLRAVQIETNGLAQCCVLLALIVILGRIFGFKTCFNL